MDSLIPPRHPPARAGFTRLEILIAAVSLALLGLLSLPLVEHIREKRRAAAFIDELRRIEHSLNQCERERGRLPPDTEPGVMPADLALYLAKFDFATPTPLGGLWDWDRQPAYQRLSVAGLAAARALMVDEMIDDGNLRTGNVRFDGQFRYYLWWR